jgi:hypothetical protein
MGFSSIQKTASTGSSATGALVGANSLQPDRSPYRAHDCLKWKQTVPVRSTVQNSPKVESELNSVTYLPSYQHPQTFNELIVLNAAALLKILLHFFFSSLPNCPIKMSLVKLGHILLMPRHIWAHGYAHFWCVMDTEKHNILSSVHHMPKMCIILR